jgi:hypothetical protein
MYETSPSPENYQVGGNIITLDYESEAPIDLGNIAGFSMDPSDLDVLEHFSARSGQRRKDRVVVVKSGLKFGCTIDEHHPANYALFFMGNAAGNVVTPLTAPLAKHSLKIVYRNLAGVIWTFYAPKCVVRPSGASDFGDASDWSEMELEIEVIEDLENKYGEGEDAVPAPFGYFEFEDGE